MFNAILITGDIPIVEKQLQACVQCLEFQEKLELLRKGQCIIIIIVVVINIMINITFKS